MRTFQEAWGCYRTLQSHVTTYRGGVRLCRSDTLDRNAARYVEQLKLDSEAFRRLPAAEHKRVQGDRWRELRAIYLRATQWAREQTHDARTLADDFARLVERTRRDTGLSFPDLAGGLSPDGQATAALLRLQVRQVIGGLPPGRLRSVYEQALSRSDDMMALAECGAIEDLVSSEVRFARPVNRPGDTDNALPELTLIQQLREYVTDVQDLRLPSQQPDFAGLVEELDGLDRRARRWGVPMGDPVHTHEDPALVQELTAEGEPSEAVWTRANVLMRSENEDEDA